MITLAQTEKQLYLKLFLYMTLSSGSIMGIFWGIATQSIQHGVNVAVFGGLAFGIFITVSIRLIHHFSIKSVKQTYGESAANANQSRTITLRKNFDETYALCKQALQHLKRSCIADEDKDRGFIHARTGMTWKYFGEKISIHIENSSADEAKITISSNPKIKTTLIDYGKNAENVQQIIDALSKTAIS